MFFCVWMRWWRCCMHLTLHTEGDKTERDSTAEIHLFMFSKHCTLHSSESLVKSVLPAKFSSLTKNTRKNSGGQKEEKNALTEKSHTKQYMHKYKNAVDERNTNVFFSSCWLRKNRKVRKGRKIQSVVLFLYSTVVKKELNQSMQITLFCKHKYNGGKREKYTNVFF